MAAGARFVNKHDIVNGLYYKLLYMRMFYIVKVISVDYNIRHAG